MSEGTCIIVGASHAAAQLAPSLRQGGWKGKITIIGNDYFLPYHRPPLSKEYLSGKKSIDDILIRPPAVYRKARVRFLLGVRAEVIDRESKRLVLDDAEAIPYDKLVLTVGSEIRRLNVPGAELPGVFYLREISDVEQIKGFMGSGKNAVIVGGGYIGLETAAVLVKLGMNVTVLEALPRVLARVTTAEISAFYARIHREEGVNIVTDALVKEISGSKSVERVSCEDGRSYPADFIIAGIGIVPATRLAEDAGLEVRNGIVVDEYSRTSDHDILAAGDCTSHHNRIYGRRVRLESVQNAVDQAMNAAATLCGKPKPYGALPWFWSDQYDLKLQIAGLSEGFDRVVVRGTMKTGRKFSAFYLKNGHVIAVDAINSPQDFMLGKRMITGGSATDAAMLADENVPLKQLL